MKASDVMTPNVISVGSETSVIDAAQLMLKRNISGLPVIDGGRLVGILTEGDLLRRTETGTVRHRPRWLEFLVGPGKLAEEYARASGRKVHEVMTPYVHNISENAGLEEAVRTMEKHQVKRLPVVRGDTVVGIITRANLVRALVNAPEQFKPRYSDDEDIRKRLVAELQKQPWAPVGAVDVFVKDGVVTLSGAVMDDRQREALRIAAENVVGVKEVDNQVVWIEPVSGMVVEAQPG